MGGRLQRRREAIRGRVFGLAGLAAAMAIVGGSAAADIIKPPDLGPFWNPLDGGSGTFVYTSDFVATGADLQVQRLGMWLLSFGGTQSFRLEVWGDNGSSPDPTSVLSTTGSVNPIVTGSLQYYEFAASTVNLVNGTRYWFVATVVGEGGGASYQVGGHTQNSVYNDNGTFWYSNDPSGINFDGQALVPQMAFGVILGPVPAPAALALLGMAGMLGSPRRRRD